MGQETENNYDPWYKEKMSTTKVSIQKETVCVEIQQ